MTREEKTTKYLRYWQRQLGLQGWNIGLKFCDFRRADNFPQSGDIKVDTGKQQATILLTNEVTGKDEVVILHELIHLTL